MKKLGSITLSVLLRVFLIFWCITIVFPLVWMIYSSFKNNPEFYASPWALPGAFRWENYVEAWEVSNFGTYFFNSFIVVMGTTLLTFLMVTTSSYVLAKYKYWGTKFFNNFYLLCMMIPGVLLLMPRYFHLLGLGLTDNLWILILLGSVGAIPGSCYILVGFMKSVHNSFIEAAVVDGAGEWTIYTKIMIPFTKPAIFMVMLGKIMGAWNDFETALTYLQDESLYTVPIGLSYLTNSMTYHADYGPMFAALVLAMVPILVLYAIFQKQIMFGTSASDGIKG